MTPHPVALAIKRLMAEQGVKPDQLAGKCKPPLNRSAIYDILSGRSQNPTIDTIERISNVLGVTLYTLLRDADPEVNETPDGEAPVTISDNMISVQELDVRAAAGSGALHEIEEVVNTWQIPKDLVKSFTSTPPDHILIASIVGDSMEPTLLSGTKVMIDTRDRRPSPPGVFFVFDGVGLVAKRVVIVPGSDPLRVRLISDNERYPSYEVTLEEAHIQGRVMGRWQWM